MPTERLLDEAADEIERLRSARASAFEEAAKIADEFNDWGQNGSEIAAVIREHGRK